MLAPSAESRAPTRVELARVRSATVDLRQVQGRDLQIVVSAGRGFDPAKLKRPDEAGGGFGPFSIRERLDLIGGKIEADVDPAVFGRGLTDALSGGKTS